MTASGVVVCTCFDIRSARRTAGPCAQVVVSANRKSGACGSTLYGAHHPPRRSNPLVFLGNVASTNPRVARAYVRFASLSNVPGKRRTCNQLMATSNSFSRSKLGLPHLRHQLRQHCSQCSLLRHVAADASQPVLRVSDVLCAQNVFALPDLRRYLRHTARNLRHVAADARSLYSAFPTFCALRTSLLCCIFSARTENTAQTAASVFMPCKPRVA